jgi:hypothetical protein
MARKLRNDVHRIAGSKDPALALAKRFYFNSFLGVVMLAAIFLARPDFMHR